MLELAIASSQSVQVWTMKQEELPGRDFDSSRPSLRYLAVDSSRVGVWCFVGDIFLFKELEMQDERVLEFISFRIYLKLCL